MKENYIDKTIEKAVEKKTQRVYVEDPSQAPEGVQVQVGPQEGTFYEEEVEGSGEEAEGAEESEEGSEETDSDETPPHERWSGGNNEFEESLPNEPWTWSEPDEDEIEEWIDAAQTNEKMSKANKSFEKSFHGDDNTYNEYTHENEEGETVWDEERKQKHEKAVEKHLEENKEAKTDEDEQPVGVILLGPPGAGKGWWEDNVEDGEYNDDFGREFLRISSDDTKPDVPEYTGTNAAEVHDEASHIAKSELQPEAIDEEYNLMYDSVATTPGDTMDIMDEMEEQGYDVRAVYVDAPKEKSVLRATTRFEDEGRYTPLDYVKTAREGSRETWDMVTERVDDSKVGEFVNDEYGEAPRVRGNVGEDIFKWIQHIISGGKLYD